MKRVLHGENARLWIWIWFAAVAIVHLRKSAGELEGSFPSLRAAVAKKNAVKPGDSGQQPREFRLILVKEQIGHMNQTASLTFNRLLDRGMIVAERVNSDSAQEKKISKVPGIPEIHAAPAYK